MDRKQRHNLPWSVLRSLDREQAGEFMDRCSVESLKPGDPVFEQGASAGFFYLVDEGQLSVTVSNHEDEVMLAVLTRGDTFGELALIDENSTRSATVRAISNARVKKISRPDFFDLRRHGDFDKAMIAILSDLIRRLSDQVADSRLDAQTKVRHKIADLAIAFEAPGRNPTVIPLTQQQIAQLVGVGRQAANAALKELEREGLVRLGRRSIEILEPPAPAGGPGAA